MRLLLLAPKREARGVMRPVREPCSGPGLPRGQLWRAGDGGDADVCAAGQAGQCRRAGAKIVMMGQLQGAKAKTDQIAPTALTYHSGLRRSGDYRRQGRSAWKWRSRSRISMRLSSPSGRRSLRVATAIKHQRPKVQVIGVNRNSVASFRLEAAAGPRPFATDAGGRPGGGNRRDKCLRIAPAGRSRD